MTNLLILSFAVLTQSHAEGPATVASAPERRVVLASNHARAVITETKKDGQFYFERCFLPNSAKETVAEELNTADFKDCVEINRALPDTDEMHAELGRQFQESLNTFFERHRRSNVGSMTAVAGVAGLFVGGLAPMLPIRYIHSAAPRRIAFAAIASGLLSAYVAGNYALDHMDELGLGREVEESLDSDLSVGVILLDTSATTPYRANQALGVFELALDDATASTIAGTKRPN